MLRWRSNGPLAPLKMHDLCKSAVHGPAADSSAAPSSQAPQARQAGLAGGAEIENSVARNSRRLLQSFDMRNRVQDVINVIF